MKQKGYSKVKYYAKIWYVTLMQSLSKAGTYRVEVVARAARGVFLVISQVILINAMLGSSSDFVGWSRDEMYLLAGVFNIINYFGWAFFSINLWRLEEKILKGEFDFILLKPFSSIFGASFTEFFIDDAVSAISGFILIGYYVVNNIANLTVYSTMLFIISVASAFIIWFSFELIFASLDFIRVKNGLREIKKQVVGIGKYPVDIWGNNAKYILYTILPVAFVGSVPARVFDGSLGWEIVLVGVIISISFLLLARSIWYISLKRYTSVG